MKGVGGEGWGVDQSEKKREASVEKRVWGGGGGEGFRDVREWGREELRERCI